MLDDAFRQAHVFANAAAPGFAALPPQQEVELAGEFVPYTIISVEEAERRRREVMEQHQAPFGGPVRVQVIGHAVYNDGFVEYPEGDEADWPRVLGS